VPAGVFIPSVTIGSAFGRLFGECMFAWFPTGIRGIQHATQAGEFSYIHPAVYSVVGECECRTRMIPRAARTGAASFCGAVTHSVSVVVILFELTGQTSFILPTMVGVVRAHTSLMCTDGRHHSHGRRCVFTAVDIRQYYPNQTSSILTRHTSIEFSVCCNARRVRTHGAHNFSVHTVHVEQIMVRDVSYLSGDCTYR
jgi:hypothetical protein